MKDVTGQDLHIGDICLYSSGKGRHLNPGVITSITEKSMVFGGPHYVLPICYNAIKLTGRQVFGLGKTWLKWLERDFPDAYARAASALNRGV